MIIAVDFDGTIVEHKYPQIGKPITFAIETLKELQKQDHIIILWTYRTGKYLDDAVEYCRSKGLEFYAVNSNEPDDKFDIETMSRKIYADVYIDDRNIGGLIPWSEIWQRLNSNIDQNEEIIKSMKNAKENKLFSSIKKLF